MRIAYDHQIFVMQEYGGVSRYYARIAAELASRGETVRIVAPLHINAYLGDLPGTMVQGRRLAATPWRGRLARTADAALAPALMRAFAPDIVHETYFGPRICGRGRRVLTVYDMIQEKFPELFPAGDPTAEYKRIAVARADHILCISETTRADLVAYIPDAAAKSSVVLLGFDLPPIATPAKTDRPYLLYVGERRGYKNFAGLLDAYAGSSALCGNYDLVAVGGLALSDVEISTIERYGLTRQVHHVTATDAALASWYAGAAVFVYPSLYEGFGIPPLEAMAAGVPVVAMRAASIPEVCGDAVAYAEPDDPGSLGVAIAHALNDAPGLRARGTARLARFSWAKCADATLAAYRGLV